MNKKPSTSPKKKNKKEKKKKNYKVRNWREYNQALVNRGSVFFWITEKALERWNEQKKTGKRGKPKMYSNTAIETAIVLSQVFHLPLRQTEGFLASILKKLGSDNKAPDYSTVSIRMETVSVKIRVRGIGAKPLHIVIDSTGAKVYGEGEWKVRQHGWSKHRTWKKLHIGVDETSGDIIISEVTGNDTADCKILEPLLAQLPENTRIRQVSADGAYDKRLCYDVLGTRKVAFIAIPPRHNAKIWQHGNSTEERLARDENLRRIRNIGRSQWKQEINYHRRSLAETAMFRLKTIFTDRVRARKEANQRIQLLVRCKALNLMTTLGMPDTYVVA
jgi:hypothetical protein